MKKTLWPEGLVCPTSPEQVFRSDLRELSVVARVLAHGSAILALMLKLAAYPKTLSNEANHG